MMISDSESVSRTLQRYSIAMERWIQAIRAEEDLALSHPSVADVDEWEHAHFAEEEARHAVNQARSAYTDSVRREQFGF